MLSTLKRPTLVALAKAPTALRACGCGQRQASTRLGSRVSRVGRSRAAADAGGASTPGAWSVSLGQGAVMGGAAVGLGALCWYGAGLNGRPSALDKSFAWPAFVRQRVRDTYGYFGVGVAATTAATVAAFRSPLCMRLLHSGGWGSALLGVAAVVGGSFLVQALPYQPGLGAKQAAWLGFSGMMGCLLAPVCSLGGQLALRAAVTTAGIFGGLSAVAGCAPDGQFLTWGGPLGIGLGVVFASSLGSAFLGPASGLGVTLYSVSMYGGLLLFSGFLLFDTQRVVQRAQTQPRYDPVNGAIHIYMDAVNIFVRVAALLGGGGGKRK